MKATKNHTQIYMEAMPLATSTSPPALEQVLGLVTSVQSEHELLFLVLGGESGKAVVHAEALVAVFQTVLEALLVRLGGLVGVLVQVHHHVPQHHKVHLPAPLAQRGSTPPGTHAVLLHHVTLFVLLGILHVGNLGGVCVQR